MNKIICFFICVLFVVVGCTKKPVADFSFSSPTRVGEIITFVNLSENADEYLWDFGDGFTSTQSDPSHAFEKPGSYTVSLEAFGEKESSYANKELQITGITYSFKNSTSYDLPSFYSYYWDGTDILDMVTHGPLSRNMETDAVITERSSVWFGVIIGDVVLVSEEYSLTSNKHNQIIITDNTPIYGGKGSIVVDTRMIFKFEAKIKKIQNE
jgi:hypothetical protein